MSASSQDDSLGERVESVERMEIVASPAAAAPKHNRSFDSNSGDNGEAEEDQQQPALSEELLRKSNTAATEASSSIERGAGYIKRTSGLEELSPVTNPRLTMDEVQLNKRRPEPDEDECNRISNSSFNRMRDAQLSWCAVSFFNSF